MTTTPKHFKTTFIFYKIQISQVSLNETGKELILNAEHHIQDEVSGKKKTLGFLEYKVLNTENYEMQ